MQLKWFELKKEQSSRDLLLLLSPDAKIQSWPQAEYSTVYRGFKEIQGFYRFNTSSSLLMLSESWFASSRRRSPSPRTSCASCLNPLTAERFLYKKQTGSIAAHDSDECMNIRAATNDYFNSSIHRLVYKLSSNSKKCPYWCPKAAGDVIK